MNEQLPKTSGADVLSSWKKTQKNLTGGIPLVQNERPRVNIYLLFLDDPTAKSRIATAMNDWTNLTKGCITFKKRTTETAYVSMFRGSG